MRKLVKKLPFTSLLYVAIVFVVVSIFPEYPRSVARTAIEQSVPVPLLAQGHPVDWWFAFKLNSGIFPNCGGAKRACPFGGTIQKYTDGQQYVLASSESQTLTQGTGCVGDTGTDPIGATFGQVYNGSFHYVIWNDQFYNDPPIKDCPGTYCSSPWGHSKGMIAWNDDGKGFVMQVTTPSWPAAGSKKHPRTTDGNSLGCVKDDNVLVSQHFFALKLNKDDLVSVLKALQNSSVVTDPTNPQIVSNGGPDDVQQLVNGLGKLSSSTTFQTFKLSSGVELISKPSNLHVPTWQMVSAILGGVSLRAATWWEDPAIPTTTASTPVKCWDASLSKPGAVQIATTGIWAGKVIGLTGGDGSNYNHAKIGVSLSGSNNYAIFGDMNQQGTLSGSNCGSSQNGRGGLFYVVDNKELSDSVAALIKGSTASTKVPSSGSKPKPKTKKRN
jgi:Deoxyribonuclease II